MQGEGEKQLPAKHKHVVNQQTNKEMDKKHGDRERGETEDLKLSSHFIFVGGGGAIFMF